MQQLSNKTKWSYSVGCIGRDMNFVLVALFLLPYIQYTMNLSIAQFSAISAIMIFSRLWDAVNDPMMGMLVENVQLKGGKYKPWILLGGLLNFSVLLLMFTFRPEGWAFVAFFGVAYIAWGMTFTINDISYYSLIPNLTKTNESRNHLTNLVQVFASIGQFLAGGLIPVLVTGDAVFMYKVIGMGVAFIFLGFTLLTYFGVRENPTEHVREENIGFKQMFSMIKDNDQLVVAGIGLLLYTVASELFMAFSMNYFYFQFGYDGDLLFYFTIMFALGILSALGMFAWLSKKYARLDILRIGLIVAIIGYSLFFSVGTILPLLTPVLFVSTFLVFFSHGLFFVTLMILIANTIEYAEVKTGERNDAIIFSIRPFMTKLGAALQQLIFTLVLIGSGVYAFSQDIAKLEIQKSAGEIGDITAQANTILAQASEPMKLYLTLGMTVIPLLLTILAYVIIKKKYIISEAKFDEYTQIINDRKG